MKKVCFIAIMIIFSIGLFAEPVAYGYVTTVGGGDPVEGITVRIEYWCPNPGYWVWGNSDDTDENGYYHFGLGESETTSIFRIIVLNPDGPDPFEYYYDFTGYDVHTDFTLTPTIEE